MKALDELGISPAPWSAVKDGMGGYEIRCGGCNESSPDYEGENVIATFASAKDARFNAAAPELYEALRGLCDWLAEGIKERGSINSHWERAMDALVKASGESEGAK